MKSDKSDDISLREVVILQNARKGDRHCVFDTLFQNTTPSFRKGVRGKHLLQKGFSPQKPLLKKHTSKNESICIHPRVQDKFI